MPEAEEEDLVLPSYVLFDIPDIWAVGYGMDLFGQLRTLQHIIDGSKLLGDPCALAQYLGRIQKDEGSQAQTLAVTS